MATTTAAGAKRSKKLGTTLGLVGFLLAVTLVLLWFRQARAVAIPENRTLFVLAFLLAAGLGIGAFVARTRWFGGLAAIGAILIGVFLPLTVAISRQELAPNGIRVGETIPHFTAIDDQGRTFDSQELQGQLVLMKFFRGHW